MELDTFPPKPKLPRAKQPRNWQDRSKYGPHQGERECARRRRQVHNAKVKSSGAMRWHAGPPTPPATEEEMLAVERQADEVRARDACSTEDRPDSADSPQV